MSSLFPAAAAVAPLVTGWSLHTLWMRRQLDRARRDPLTGLPTRAAFEKRAARLLATGPCVVLVIDLDGFKAVNDTFGHAAGDAAIRHAGTWLPEWLEAFGYTGVAARLGGDEFAVAVRVREASRLVSELRTLHEWLTVPVDFDGRSFVVGASIGAYLTSPGQEFSAVLRRADEAMYVAKSNAIGFFVTDSPDSPVRKTINGRRAGRPGTHTPKGGAR